MCGGVAIPYHLGNLAGGGSPTQTHAVKYNIFVWKKFSRVSQLTKKSANSTSCQLVSLHQGYFTTCQKSAKSSSREKFKIENPPNFNFPELCMAQPWHCLPDSFNFPMCLPGCGTRGYLLYPSLVYMIRYSSIWTW